MVLSIVSIAVCDTTLLLHSVLLKILRCISESIHSSHTTTNVIAKGIHVLAIVLVDRVTLNNHLIL